MRETFRHLVYVLYCLEAGAFLVVAPWSRLWEHNYFLETVPSLMAIAVHPALRGLVSGLGLALFLQGIEALVEAIAAARAERQVSRGSGR